MSSHCNSGTITLKTNH